MAVQFLHRHPEFERLIAIVADKEEMLPGLVEKDYWIMHVLYGLQSAGFVFELKGGTSLSKGFRIIDRFSEDIDIHIHPPASMGVNENPNNTKSATVEGRKKYYDWLAQQITIDGIIAVERDTDFDDDKYYRSGGIRLRYESVTGPVEGMKEGILLEAGFSQVTPNTPMTISSWAYDEAARHNIELIDNRAVDVPCYHIGFTFIEKLQTIATKFRQEQQDGISRPNVMRQYYDVHKLLGQQTVQDFIGTDEYAKHKKDWFPAKDYAIPIRENEAFLLHSRENRAAYKKRYEKTAALYYKGQPSFETVLATIQQHLDRL